MHPKEAMLKRPDGKECILRNAGRWTLLFGVRSRCLETRSEHRQLWEVIVVGYWHDFRGVRAFISFITHFKMCVVCGVLHLHRAA